MENIPLLSFYLIIEKRYIIENVKITEIHITLYETLNSDISKRKENYDKIIYKSSPVRTIWSKTKIR